jgi:hypothetical protein
LRQCVQRSATRCEQRYQRDYQLDAHPASTPALLLSAWPRLLPLPTWPGI